MKDNLIVEILIGVPASGKSTYSSQYVRNNANWARVNRDDFRFMLKNMPDCEPKVEDAITQMFYKAIDILLAKKMNVIVDNTNLKKSYIDEFVKHVEHRADVRFRVFDISLEKALERNAGRDRKVPEDVMKKMYKQYKNLVDSFEYTTQSKKTYVYKEPSSISTLPNIVIFDLDGTLAHSNGKRDIFDAYKCDRDDIDNIVLETYKLYRDAGYTIFIVSGRGEDARESTELWLDFYGITFEKLLMRKKDDFRKDNIVKQEIYNHYIKGKYNVRVVFDDRQQVVDMWRENGLKVYQVNQGDF